MQCRGMKKYIAVFYMDFWNMLPWSKQPDEQGEKQFLDGRWLCKGHFFLWFAALGKEEWHIHGYMEVKNMW